MTASQTLRTLGGLCTCRSSSSVRMCVREKQKQPQETENSDRPQTDALAVENIFIVFYLQFRTERRGQRRRLRRTCGSGPTAFCRLARLPCPDRFRYILSMTKKRDDDYLITIVIIVINRTV